MIPLRPFALALLAVALAGCTAGRETPAPSTVEILPAAAGLTPFTPEEALAAVNAYRLASGVAPLALDPRLVALAQEQAARMAGADELSHTLGGSIGARLTRAGYGFLMAGENIGAGYPDLGAVMAGWRASPAHDAGLKDPEATAMGLAAAVNLESRFRVFWSLILARPRG